MSDLENPLVGSEVEPDQPFSRDEERICPTCDRVCVTTLFVGADEMCHMCLGDIADKVAEMKNEVGGAEDAQ